MAGVGLPPCRPMLDYVDEEGDSAFQRGMNQRIEARIVWTIIQIGVSFGSVQSTHPRLDESGPRTWVPSRIRVISLGRPYCDFVS